MLGAVCLWGPGGPTPKNLGASLGKPRCAYQFLSPRLCLECGVRGPIVWDALLAWNGPAGGDNPLLVGEADFERGVLPVAAKCLE